MISLKHPFCNATLGPPKGMTEEQVRTLHIYREIPTSGLSSDYAVTSFWTPEPAELETLNSGGSVMLRILGLTHPPLSMRVTPKHDDAVPASGYVPFILTSDEFQSMAQELEKLRSELNGWQALTKVHDEESIYPESIIAHIEYLQGEWDTAERRIGKLDQILKWQQKFALRCLTLLFGKDYQNETIGSIRTLVAAEMPQQEDNQSISEWLEKREKPEEVIHESPIHDFFELSYSSYLVVPRSLLQSCSFGTQKALCDALERAYKEEEIHMPHHWPHEAVIEVRLKDAATNKYITDDYSSYDRGRRRLW